MRTPTLPIGLAIALGGLATGCGSPPQPPASAYYLVLNPTSPSHQAACRAGLESLLASARPGEAIHVLEAPDLRLVARVVVPDVPPSARPVHYSVSRQLAALRPLLKEPRPAGGGQLNLPELSNAIVRLRPPEGLTPRVLLAGSPVFDEPRFRGDSWLPGVAPRDGYWFDPHSPLVRGVSDFPEGTVIGLLVPPEGYGIDAAHRRAIETAWRKHAARYGAVLARYSDDPHAAFATASCQYDDEVSIDQDAPCELYVAAAQGSTSLAVQVHTRRTTVEGAAATTRNQTLRRMAEKTGGLALLVDHSASTVGVQNAAGDLVASPERLAEFRGLRRKLAALLERAEADYLNVVAFGVNSGEGAVDAVWPTMQPATPENRAHAQQRLRGFQAGSGTPALRALQLALSDHRCTRVVLVTDGLPGSGQAAVLDWLAKAREVRDFELFTIGIGDPTAGDPFASGADWPVREFLTAAAAENRGAYVEWALPNSVTQGR